MAGEKQEMARKVQSGEENRCEGKIPTSSQLRKLPKSTGSKEEKSRAFSTLPKERNRRERQPKLKLTRKGREQNRK
jgi:hypothetical protein